MAANRWFVSKKLAHPKRVELLTPRFVVWCSIQLSYGCSTKRGLAEVASDGNSSQAIKFVEKRIAHFCRAEMRPAGGGDVRGAAGIGEDVFHGLLDQGCVFLHVEGVAQQHGEAEDLGQRVGDAFARDVRRAAVNRLVEGMAAARIVHRAQRGGGEQAE